VYLSDAWGSEPTGVAYPTPLGSTNQNKNKNMRNKKGQFTSISSYWNKNRKKWLTLVCLTIIASSIIYFNGLLALEEATTSPAEASEAPLSHETTTIDELCSLPYIDCGTASQRAIKEYAWVKFNQNLGYEVALRAMDIITCESGWNPDAINVNTNGTVDRGLVQINSIHKDISNAQAFDYQQSINWMINKYWADGNNFNAWVCNRLIR